MTSSPRSQNSMLWATWIAVLLAVIGVVVAVLAWQLPKLDAGSNGGTPTLPQPQTQPQPPPGPAGEEVFLNIHDFETDGRANLVALPKELKGQPGYVRAMVVGCPSNQTGDRQREVTFQLSGRYEEFRATVEPYYERDRPWWVDVDVIVGTDVNGTVNTANQEGPNPLTKRAAQEMSVDVARAKEITVHVECERPGGVAILRDPRVVTAG